MFAFLCHIFGFFTSFEFPTAALNFQNCFLHDGIFLALFPFHKIPKKYFPSLKIL